MQGSIHLHHIAAKAVCLGEAQQPSFRQYGQQVIANARALGDALLAQNIPVLTSGTDTHLLLANVGGLGLTGQVAQQVLEQADITSNKNAIPGDPVSPARWSGVRLGSAAITSRGLKEDMCRRIGYLIGQANCGVLYRARRPTRM